MVSLVLSISKGYLLVTFQDKSSGNTTAKCKHDEEAAELENKTRCFVINSVQRDNYTVGSALFLCKDIIWDRSVVIIHR